MKTRIALRISSTDITFRKKLCYEFTIEYTYRRLVVIIDCRMRIFELRTVSLTSKYFSCLEAC